MDFFRRTWVEIDINALKYNFRAIKKMSGGVTVCPVVKADAYGHGSPVVAKALSEAGADWFAVSNLPEAVEIRNSGIDADILILGYTPAEYAGELAKNNITQCVFSTDYAKELSKAAKKQGVNVKTHLKIDTGMGRIGFRHIKGNTSELLDAKEALVLENLNYTGIFMHFSVADSFEPSDEVYTKEQYESFTEAIAILENMGFSFEKKHCCNSAGIITGSSMGFNMTRAGIIVYGLAPSEDMPAPEGLIPVMSMYSVVSHIKTVHKGDSICYGRSYIADSDRLIATVSAGYADGIPRCLSNNGSVLIKGKEVPITGRVCMDQFCVDVTDIPDVALGDVVTLFDKDFSVDIMAKRAGTVNYEIICEINKRVPRIYI